MLKSNSFKAFLTTAILVATTAKAFAASEEAERGDLNSIAIQLVAAANVALWVFAAMGLVMAAIGARRIASARTERKKPSPALHYKYSEGFWRIGVGLGLILVPVCATFIAPTHVG